jgi:sec-independent protein translocase protein TatA
MGPLGPEEMVAIFILALLLFGPKELPKLGKTIGKAMTEFRKAQTEIKSTFSREMQNLERETGLKELSATAFNPDSYNYDTSTYDTSYYDGSYNSPVTTTPANGASAILGAESTAALQVNAAAGSIASGHMDNGHIESAWDPYTPAEHVVAHVNDAHATSPAPAEHGHTAPDSGETAKHG